MPNSPPLYSQVRQTLVERLVDKVWSPGERLPAETEICGEMGVSQGTLRKAVESLCAEGALRRVQGRGTFVVEMTEELARQRFFRLVGRDGTLVTTELIRQSTGQGVANSDSAAALSVDPGTSVHVLERVRAVDGQTTLLERIVVPEAIMPGLSAEPELPIALYPYYQAQYGVHVLRADEVLNAAGADARKARLLGVAHGTPLLEVSRRSFDLAGRAVEYRLSYFLTMGCGYRVALS